MIINFLAYIFWIEHYSPNFINYPGVLVYKLILMSNQSKTQEVWSEFASRRISIKMKTPNHDHILGSHVVLFAAIF